MEAFAPLFTNIEISAALLAAFVLIGIPAYEFRRNR